MKAEHRKILDETRELCNMLGGVLDGTSTNEAKYRDRQRALGKVSLVLFAVLADHPQNDQRDYDFEEAWIAVEHLKELAKKNYPDRKGNY